MITLSSYLCGTWQAGSGAPTSLFNPTTGEAIAEASSRGLDLAAACEHARTVGGPALRALTFAERGQLLKRLAAALHEHREELLDLSQQNGGNTRGDAKFDVDGATGTLAAYAHFSKELPDATTLADGEGIQIGRTARWWGQHVMTPKLGVAVHINAFNFPGWGMFEKLACAILAGMPVISKPGTQTALPAHRMAQIAVESGILPEGSFQFLCGSAGDLLDHLGPQDVVAFTGSAWTGAIIRGNANLVKNNVHVNVEADSLNAVVVGADLDLGSDTFGDFLAFTSKEMTQKTGQKCTAARRIFVPSDLLDEVVPELVAALERIVVGDPTDGGTGMGPVTSASQLQELREGIDALAAAGTIATGGSEPVGDKGWFLRPTLVVANDPDDAIFHEKELFGPVAVVLPYDASKGPEEAARLANKGGGSLLGAIYCDDGEWAKACALGMAPWHGRVWVDSARAKGQAMPPGMVLPSMIHGGPGRAGGGQELGGLRGLEDYLQRTAIQGFGGWVKAEFGAPEPVEAS
ncbi:MAG: 3,4-dehydroadipyl-CoA semialdehyde dehydrogenase [Planctomycetota bacterium]|nr:3,4-dehydroadipyl-CoA semialdehyde dehydrogenase [Planctomycetota bacterium]